MSRNQLILTLVLCVALAGCAQRAAEEAVAQKLRDPSSAQFRNVVAHRDIVCGEVNGKNGFGAYSGFHRFVFHTAGNLAEIDPSNEDFQNPSPFEQWMFEQYWTHDCAGKEYTEKESKDRMRVLDCVIKHRANCVPDDQQVQGIINNAIDGSDALDAAGRNLM